MYIGRIVAVGMNQEERVTVMYRVSSRSFPNRKAWKYGEMISIIPKAGHEADLNRNPYIAYNCIRLAGSCAVAANGSHTDPIIEKIGLGMNIRDALSLTLLALDYEKDNYNTPRIAAVTDRESKKGYLGIIRHDALMVREFELTPNTAYYLATYELNEPTQANVDRNFQAADATSAAQYIINGGVFSDFENPVTAAAALSNDTGFETATALA